MRIVINDCTVCTTGAGRYWAIRSWEEGGGVGWAGSLVTRVHVKATRSVFVNVRWQPRRSRGLITDCGRSGGHLTLLSTLAELPDGARSEGHVHARQQDSRAPVVLRVLVFLLPLCYRAPPNPLHKS